MEIPLFGCSYQHGLSAVEQCFSLTTKQPQPAYKPQKQPAEQGNLFLVNRHNTIPAKHGNGFVFVNRRRVQDFF
jgi:hypothetical protein